MTGLWTSKDKQVLIRYTPDLSLFVSAQPRHCSCLQATPCLHICWQILKPSPFWSLNIDIGPAAFLQTEPAVAVKADPDFTAAESSDAAALQQNAEQPSEDHPPEFKSAARREHADEAAAIRHNMQVTI